MRRPRLRINLSRRAALGVGVLCVGLVLAAATVVILTRPDSPYESYRQALDAHGTDPTNYRAVAEARAKFPDVEKAFENWQTNAFSGNAYLKSLHDKQVALDTALSQREITPYHWVNQTRNIQLEVSGALAAKYQWQWPTHVQVVDNYFALLLNDPAARDPANPNAIFEAEGRYRASLSPQDLQTLDDHVRWGGLNTTPTVAKYDAATRAISDSGYYQVADQSAKEFDNIPTWNALTQQYAGEAKQAGLKLADYVPYKRAVAYRQRQQRLFLRDHPVIDVYRAMWYGTSAHSSDAATILSQKTGTHWKWTRADGSVVP